ncbi:mucoidy inhibitor MuiA family protein [Seonamhaeicola sediminis]|uniref:Mucoidy inhibitor MuiA family protein n=1 Tax=Seonamhaeicola sediminis TaxID=2528206 RepID=A0A562YF91_9FLAO|nr:DUF4139 domain-containing protein [Seonamhaeicola sediminis]TWO32952.1 mucoidy inhibitor MuiA family protein [Seonamhaeicola sediminis]
MKKLVLLLVFNSYFSFANTTNQTPSTIKEVTIYVNGAQITRTAKITLNSGTGEFIFKKLSPKIQENSIQISGLNQASILSINYGINHINKQDRAENITEFRDKIDELNYAIQLEDNLIAGYEEELEIIQNNRQLGNENQVVNLDKLQQFTNYYRKRVTEIRGLIYKSLKKKRHLDNQIKEINQQLVELNVEEKIETGEITVKLNSEITQQLNLIIKYNVTDTGWFPVYDLKADKINSPLQLNYKAHIYQKTGSNWENVKLILSTGDPNTNNIKPDLKPKYLNFISRYSNYNSASATKNYNYKYNPFVKTVSGIITDESGSPLPGANVLVKGTSNGVVTDFDGNFNIDVSNGKELEISFLGYNTETIPIHSTNINLSMKETLEMLDEVVVMCYGTKKERDVTGAVSSINLGGVSSALQGQASGIAIRGISSRGYSSSNYKSKKEVKTNYGDIIEEGITNRRFEIKKTYSIPSDGDLTVINIDNFQVAAQYSYYAAPVVNENVFLTAKIGDWEQYNLLPGEANVYFEGSYSGKTNINPQATTDSLTVSLGIDPNVVVKRNTLNNFKKAALLGSNKTLSKAFEIEVKNNKASTISLILMDRIPVSQNKDIKIDDIDSGTSEYDSKKGLLKWNLKLLSHTSENLKLSYSVKYPKYKRVNL